MTNLDITAIELTIHVFRVCHEQDNGGVTEADVAVPILPRILHKRFVSLPHEKWRLHKVLHTTPYHGRTRAAGCVFTSIDNPKSHVVVFRGTNRLAEWEHNLRPGMRSVPLDGEANAKAHAGYLDLFATCMEALQQVSEELILGDDHEVLFTGHSLGGAMAILAAAFFLNNRPNVKVSLVVFGAPRVVNTAMRQWLEAHLAYAATYERETDPVPIAFLRFNQGEHIGTHQPLTSFGHTWWMYPLCHDMMHYHRAMCMLHNVDYTPLVRWEAPAWLAWLADKMMPPA